MAQNGTRRKPSNATAPFGLFVCTLLAISGLIAVVAARQSSDPSTPTFKTTATVLTVDAVVTDKDGRHVTDLTAEDFEVTYRGRRQTPQHATYVSSGDASNVEARATGDPEPRPEPPARVRQNPAASAISDALAVRRAKPGRTIAVVIDDLGLSFRDMADTRRALRRFVDEQIEPGDLVAIVRAGGGMGALQQFTTDRRLLHMAIDRMRWSFMSRQFGAFAAVNSGGSTRNGETPDGLRDRMLATGSLGAIEFVARGMQHLPGRKAIVLLAQGFGAMFEDRGESGQVWRALARMLDRANRAGVAIYTVDAGGLQTGGLSAADTIDPRVRDYGLIGRDTFMEPSYMRNHEHLLGAQAGRRHALYGAQEQLRFIAEQTGGLATVNNNDLNAGFRRALEDQRGYYLLGLQTPDAIQGSAWEHGGVNVRVRRSGLHVRSRQGPFGPADPRREPVGPDDPLLLAALSPFAAPGITMRLTALFGHDASAGPFVRTMLFIDANGLTFTRADDGRHVSEAEIAQLAIDDNGQVVGSWRRTLTLRLTDEQLDEARTHGVTYGTRMALEQPGAYQVRTSVQDKASARLGSASQFLEVPEVRSGRLALSGVLLQAARPDQNTVKDAEAAVEHEAADRGREDILGKPSLRIFRPGTSLVFAYEIYDGTDGTAPFEASAALLRDGTVVYRGQTDTIARQAEGPRVKTIPVGGVLSLGQQMPPGTYTLEVSVSAGKRRAAQWADFDVQR